MNSNHFILRWKWRSFETFWQLKSTFKMHRGTVRICQYNLDCSYKWEIQDSSLRCFREYRNVWLCYCWQNSSNLECDVSVAFNSSQNCIVILLREYVSEYANNIVELVDMYISHMFVFNWYVKCVTKTGDIYDQHGYHRRVSTMKIMHKWLGVWCIYEISSSSSSCSWRIRRVSCSLVLKMNFVPPSVSRSSYVSSSIWSIL
jgi:hypothetical protein